MGIAILLFVILFLYIVAIETAIEDESRFGYIPLVIAGVALYFAGFIRGTEVVERNSDTIITPSVKTICEELDGVKKCDTTYIYKFKKEDNE